MPSNTAIASTGDGRLTESSVFRKTPKFKRSEIFRWDELPVPAGIEAYGTGSHGGVDGNLSPYRERPDLSSWALVGDGNTRRFELGTGWDCALHISLADGHQRWTRQRVIWDSTLRTWITISAPELKRTSFCIGRYEVGSRTIHGGSPDMGWLDIRAFRHGMSISLESREIGVRRVWRLDHLSQRRTRDYDLRTPDASTPCVIVASDNPLSLRRTIRFVVLELTGLMVPEEFFAWSTPAEIGLEQPAMHLVSVAAAG